MRSRWREPLIAGIVVFHFTIGLLTGLPERSHLWSVPGLQRVAVFYARHTLDQMWSMFSPPPRGRYTIHYAVQFPTGWTELLPLDEVSDRIAGRIVQPRGAFRLMVFLRSVNADTTPGGLTERSDRAFYYQQLSDFFCRGVGRIPDAVAIRFYVVGRTPPNFFTTDRWGQPLSPPADLDFELPLYEQRCAGP
jgi:hypothetical protein